MVEPGWEIIENKRLIQLAIIMYKTNNGFPHRKRGRFLPTFQLTHT